MKISSKIKTAIVAASALTIAAIAAPASAGVVTFQTSGQWANVVGGSNVSTSTNGGDSTIRWGDKFFGFGDQSSYLFDAKSVGGFDMQDGETSNMFTLADFKHTNADIWGQGITAVDLLLTAKIFVDGEYVTDRTYTWNFTHNETPNNCWGSNCASDIVKVAYNGAVGGDSFQVGNDLYTLTLGGFYGKQGNTYTPQDTYITKENKSATAYIRGNLSMTTLTSAVPEPATWAMMLVGFFGAGSMLRTTRRKELMATAA